MLAERLGSPGSGLCPSGSLGLLFGRDSTALSCDEGLPAVESSDGWLLLPPAAACCCAMSFLDAFPRFLRSRMYSHVRPNSTVVLASLSCKVTLG
jgi:hypothetical protein